MSRRPRVHCFGCSHTKGVEGNDYFSWVNHLATLVPTHDFFNYGAGGTSELFHAYLLRTLPDRRPGDLTIFQATHKGRLTWWNKTDFHNYIECWYDNHYLLPDRVISNNTGRINYGILQNRIISPSTTDEFELAKLYYGTVSEPYIRENYYANIDYALQFTDYSFFHRTIDLNKYQLDCFQQDIGNELWESYLIDSGAHLSKEGAIHQGEWVYERIQGLL